MSFRSQVLAEGHTPTDSASREIIKQRLTRVTPRTLSMSQSHHLSLQGDKAWQPTKDLSNALPNLFEGKYVSLLTKDVFSFGPSGSKSNQSIIHLWLSEATTYDSDSWSAERKADVTTYTLAARRSRYHRERRTPVMVSHGPTERPGTGLESGQTWMPIRLRMPDQSQAYFQESARYDGDGEAIRICDTKDDALAVSGGTSCQEIMLGDKPVRVWDIQWRKLEDDIYLVSLYQEIERACGRTDVSSATNSVG